LREVGELSCFCCSCETDAVRRPAASLFVEDAQSSMRLSKTGSRRSRYPLLGSRMPLLASRTNSLAAARLTESVAQLQKTHDSSLTSAMHSPPCPKVLRSSHAQSPLLLLSSAEAVTTWKPASLAASRVAVRRVASRNGTEAYSNWLQCTFCGCLACLQVAYARNICEFEWSFRSRCR